MTGFQYINSITARFDPHTNYFAAEKERFDVSIAGKGIGARLQKE
jgi:carboxyl-terminal processing protease